jgi:ribonuclease-3
MDPSGHSFARPELLVRALTHASIATPTRPDNQRLEFLGDRVLGLTMAEALFQRRPAAPKASWRRAINALVRKGETCAAIAREIGLGEVLKLGRSEMLSGGRRKEALLADAMEAVIWPRSIWMPASTSRASGAAAVGPHLDNVGQTPATPRPPCRNGRRPRACRRRSTGNRPQRPRPRARIRNHRDAGQRPPRRGHGKGTKRSIEQPPPATCWTASKPSSSPASAPAPGPSASALPCANVRPNPSGARARLTVAKGPAAPSFARSQWQASATLQAQLAFSARMRYARGLSPSRGPDDH